MCGIAGFVSGAARSSDDAAAIAAGMAAALRHRGPDAGGTWISDDGVASMAHRRLSILDLSIAGSQPMRSHGGRYTITFNGEIYNFNQLRSKVEAKRGVVAWRGHSDTEALLESVAEFGVERAVESCQGMFAFAVWDSRDSTLTLARDRFGKKPLYYGMIGRDFAFASEVVALRRHPSWVFRPDRNALVSFLRAGYVPETMSAFDGIQKLPPGSLLTLGMSDVLARRIPPSCAWWRPSIALGERPLADPERIGDVLREAVGARLVSDVPLGAFLSGGVDSTIVVALMKQLAGSVRTFTIGFSDSPSDEAAHAAKVAAYLGTDHVAYTLTPQEAIEITPGVMACFDEPFADASAVPTWLVARLASRDVKVVLTGDGADELFGGYTRYGMESRLWRLRAALPSPLRAMVGGAVNARLKRSGLGRWSAIVHAMTAPDLPSFYQRRTSHFRFTDTLLPGAIAGGPVYPTDSSVPESPERSMMSIDLLTYLPGDILVKVDRATMAHGLEARSPFLDDAVARFAWGLADEALFDTAGGKRLLRHYLYGIVPRQLVDRPKTGFGFPVERWLRGRMRAWAEGILFGTDWHREIECDRQVVRAAWEGLLAGNLRVGGGIWNLIVLAMWIERQKGRGTLVQ